MCCVWCIHIVVTTTKIKKKKQQRAHTPKQNLIPLSLPLLIVNYKEVYNLLSRFVVFPPTSIDVADIVMPLLPLPTSYL